MRISLIVPAAGLGKRFTQSLARSGTRGPACSSKLFYELGGEPVLLKTLRVFQSIPGIREVLVTISPEMRPEVKKWTQRLQGRKIRWVPGGKTRAESVWNALQKTSSRSEWIMVHDGARPLVMPEAVRQVILAAKDWDSASKRSLWDGVILGRKVVPTIKKVLQENGHICETVDRSTLYEAETPQLVRRDMFFKAYRQNPRAFEATDEAGLLEAVGGRVRVVAHEGWNPKLTIVKDLELAKAVTESRVAPEVRVGIGFDTHRLVEGRKFYLGGVVIPSAKGPLGHSDGDALLHALADAVLGAIGGGDIGEWFSDRDPKFRNIRSTKILAVILAEAKRQGWQPYHADTNIILEAPRLLKHKPKIRKSVAQCLGLLEKDVSIKARTREGLGPEGEGLAVTCEAVVSMKKIRL